jgi:hypothetical protein
MLNKLCKDDKTRLIDEDEIGGPDHIKAAYDPLRLKRFEERIQEEILVVF